jgi:rhamnosyltransferase
MISNSVCAVVVTYHPADDVLENLKKVREQVQTLVVVDNGSSEQELATLRRASSDLVFHLVENGENLGIAAALNIGVLWAQANSFHWIILFDQDSCVTGSFIETMLRACRNSPSGDRLGIMIPKYVEKRLGTDMPGHIDRNGQLEVAMTSGSLLPVSIFQEYGLFNESLFIDSVDYEFSFRLRSKGFRIEECSDAILLHSLGTPEVHRLLGKTIFRTANYSPSRHYYQERNKVWLTRRYWRKYPLHCSKLLFSSVKDHIKILLAESQKWKKCYFSAMGVVDGLLGHMGKTDRF